jgi:DNA-binding NtrC family response regulator/CHASE2 domain-containing sensor protein
MHARYFSLGIGITLAALCITALLPAPFNEIEKIVLKADYRARGEYQADTSVIVLSLDNDDIAALGGLPLKRSYYALLVNALKDLGARAVGIDVAFTEKNTQFPEYDRLLASVVQRSGNVVLSAYFRSLQPGAEGTWAEGNHLDLPYPELSASAAGIGHTNLTDDLTVPAYIRNGRETVPAFALELLRVGSRLPAQAFSEPPPLRLADGKEIPTDSQGGVMLNFPGDASSIRTASVVDVLKSYDARKSGKRQPFPVETLRGKYIIVGVVAEGRSSFLQTPWSSQFPAVCIHAVFLDNALHGDFLRQSPAILRYGLGLLVGILCTLVMGTRRELLGLAGVAGLAVLTLVTSLLLFIHASILLPAAVPLFSLLAVASGLLLTRHRAIKRELHSLVREREGIAESLRQKEHQITLLENELHTSRAGRRAPILEELQRFKNEVTQLKSLEADLVPSPVTAAGQDDRRSLEFSSIVYAETGPMAEVVSLVKKIAGADATVLILGESGTGKELVAQAIHQHSPRREKPFVAVNCGALAETLLESELFGHERGAFTGAVRERKGRFEVADGGTIFLDEIGEVTEAFQVKLLRVLQDGSYERVGGTRTEKVDVRVIAATNRDLLEAVRTKEFREDLYYRINVLPVRLPPLRERREDIPVLARHFLRQESPEMQTSDAVMNVLTLHQWKGNVRELQSILRRAALYARSEGRSMLRMKDLPPEMVSELRPSADIEERIISALREKMFSHSAISETADELGGLNRGTVAEYFRGYCFRTFTESGWSFEDTALAIAGTLDETARSRVAKKLSEYLQNAVEFAVPSKPPEEVRAASKPKFKNLPQRYHIFLEAIIASACRKEWKLPDQPASRS